ncbi:MAG: hypothetical protein HETSPECPRED_000590 [Heterodermia speciosa]|uniref:Uncharacterized protein n=1 Tax=Heterodermia speciosa TaxID=116794 RepID=A0A8H3GCL4_9LECA|nr:MAG: hypothetical protein HETSPECPRED_000590 [Heterodermia speciosa]
MDGKISLAWAIEVDYCQLGTRLEAYIKSKAAVTTLRACFSRYRVPAKGKLAEREVPQEIQNLIVDAMENAAYESTVQAWTYARLCAENKCETPNQLCKVHPPPNQNNQTFESQFRIRPFYTVLAETDRYYEPPEFTGPLRVSAYLTMSVVDAPMDTEPGIEKAFYTVRHKIDHTEILEGPSPEIQHLFKEAVRALRLESPHTKTEFVVGRGSTSSNKSESESDVRMRSFSSDPAEEEEAEDEGEEDLEGNEDGGYVPFCIDCCQRVCKGRFRAPKPALMMLACGEMKAYSAENGSEDQ